jgi:hypothetical protein
VRQHRGLDGRRPRAPLVTRTLLALFVVLLAGGAFVLAAGGVGPLLSTLGAGFQGAVDRLVATPVPTEAALAPSVVPRIVAPDQPYTNQELIELEVTVPTIAVGDPDVQVRIYLALEGLEPAPVVDWPVGDTFQLVIPFELEEGRNAISATLVRGTASESEHSPIVTWILDLKPPKINVQSPKDGENIETPDAIFRGSTQASTTLVTRNLANSASISTVAGRDGSFEFQLPLVEGDNQIEITGTDPAGNQRTKTMTLVQGSTEMRVRLTASLYTISVKNHPSSLELHVLVRDPSGDPIAGATAFFTLQIPGLAPISNEIVTGPDGMATFSTPLVGELETGGGVATVLVTDETYGERTDRITLTFVK